jgi:peptidoglycan-associated lipoprotein
MSAMNSTNRNVVLGFFFAGVLFAVSGCKPDYPTCETDKDCKAKEFCVARKCQQCRDSRDCGAGQQCNNGKCATIPGYCTDRSQCPAGQECIANRCRTCASDTECPSGLKCVQGQCKKAQCTTDDDCPQDQECQNGACIGRPKKVEGPPCNLTPVYFGFDQAALTAEATNSLNTDAQCLKKATGRQIDVVGRADPRGTTEYNMALADRRSQAVKDYLQRLGVEANRLNKVPRGALDATGTDDAGWAKDRRVDFDWR